MTLLVLYDSIFDYMAFELYSEIDIDISNKSNNSAGIQQVPSLLVNQQIRIMRIMKETNKKRNHFNNLEWCHFKFDNAWAVQSWNESQFSHTSKASTCKQCSCFSMFISNLRTDMSKSDEVLNNWTSNLHMNLCWTLQTTLKLKLNVRPATQIFQQQSRVVNNRSNLNLNSKFIIQKLRFKFSERKKILTPFKFLPYKTSRSLSHTNVNIHCEQVTSLDSPLYPFSYNLSAWMLEMALLLLLWRSETHQNGSDLLSNLL